MRLTSFRDDDLADTSIAIVLTKLVSLGCQIVNMSAGKEEASTESTPLPFSTANDHSEAGLGVQPSGTVGLLFTDIEGSTRLLQQLGAERYSELLERHRALIRGACAPHEGYEVEYEGDAFFMTFASAHAAVASAFAAQRALVDEPWPAGAEIRVRMGVHVGKPLLRPPKYVGIDVHRAARIRSAAHGGQVILSRDAADSVQERFELRDLGEHRLKDLADPVRLFQLRGAGLIDHFPAPLGLRSRTTHLPVPPHRLLGRDHELSQLETILERPDVRLVTLTGTGGVGKSRLALEAAGKVARRFADGAVFVDLAPVGSAADVLAAVAHALDVHAQPAESIRETLVASVGDNAMLVLLDNFEHVVEAAPEIGAVLAAAPKLKAIATSRRRLNIAGEHVFPVTPLDVGGRPAAVGAAGASAAARLFAERAQAVSSFELVDANAAVVTELCARLDGLPLAIELAAARASVLSEHEILVRLRNRFALLHGGRADADPRQRTLRATLDWSYALLDPGEQRLIATLAAFAGGCTLQAIEYVHDDAGVVDGLAVLVENHLVNRAQTEDGESRYSMLETIHEYARERLVECDAIGVQRRQAEYVADLAEAAEQGTGGTPSAWLRRLEREEANIRTAIEWTIDHDPDVAARIVGALWSRWAALGHLADAREWTTVLLGKSSDDDSVARARLLHAAAHFAQGVDAAASRLLSEECLSLSRRVGYKRGLAMSLNYLALDASSFDAERAHMLGQEAVEVAEGLSDSSVLEHCLGALQMSLIAEGDYSGADRVGERILALTKTANDPSAVARALGNLAYSYICSGEYAMADPLAEESLSMQREIGTRSGVGWAAGNAGFAALFSGDLDRAEARFREALTLTGSFGHKSFVAESMIGLAAVAAARSQTSRASQLAGAARALLEEVGGQPTVVERRIDELYLRGASIFDGARDAGESSIDLSFDEIIHVALAQDGPLTGISTNG